MDGYRIMKHLGEGGFGQVVLAQTRSTKQVSTCSFTISIRSWTDAQLVAIKTIKKRSPDYDRKIELLREEAAILSTLDHVHIIRLLEDEKVGPIDYFVMEYCPGGDLRGAIEDAKQRK
jgi:serine/threonine protein kinase